MAILAEVPLALVNWTQLNSTHSDGQHKEEKKIKTKTYGQRFVALTKLYFATSKSFVYKHNVNKDGRKMHKIVIDHKRWRND